MECLHFAKRFTLDPPPFRNVMLIIKGNKKNLEYCQSVGKRVKKDCFVRCVNEKINGENKTENGGSIVK